MDKNAKNHLRHGFGFWKIHLCLSHIKQSVKFGVLFNIIINYGLGNFGFQIRLI